MKKRNFKFAFEIIFTLIIFTLLAIANILNGARTTARVEREIAMARGGEETSAPAIAGSDREDEVQALKNP